VEGTPANISATPATGYDTLVWSIVSGAGSFNEDSSQFTPTEDVTLLASFSQLSTYTIDTTVIGEGIWTITPGITNIESGATVSYSATAAEGYVFKYYLMSGDTGWSADTSFLIMANRVDTVVFIKQFTLTGSTVPSGASLQDSGSVVSIEAIAGDHWHFIEWDTTGTIGVDDLTDPTTTCTLSVEDATVNAIFERDTFYISRSGSWLSSLDLDSIYAYGDTSTLTCSPVEDSVAKWPGGIIYGPSEDTLKIYVTEDSTVVSNGYLITTIDTARCKYLRGPAWDYFRINDTGTLVINEMYDSTEVCSLWINRNRTIQAPILRWFNNVYPEKDSVQFRVPVGVPLNYFYRMRIMTPYGILNPEPNAHNIFVKGQVR
jgi:hypothetical protein